MFTIYVSEPRWWGITSVANELQRKFGVPAEWLRFPYEHEPMVNAGDEIAIIVGQSQRYQGRVLRVARSIEIDKEVQANFVGLLKEATTQMMAAARRSGVPNAEMIRDKRDHDAMCAAAWWIDVFADARQQPQAAQPPH